MLAVEIQWRIGQSSGGNYDNGDEGYISGRPDLDWRVRESLSKEVSFNFNWER